MASRLRAHIPTALLALALAALFAFGGDRGYFYRNEIHNRNSAKTMALAENLSPAHAFRLFQRVWIDEDGVERYSLYSRFPHGGPLLVKAATFWFGDDLSAKLLAGRYLMLAMYAAAALFAYLAIARVSASRWVALAASLFAFSGYHSLYHSDGVANETVMELFGSMLAFHGAVVFVQEGKFRQSLFKTFAALLLGWRVYALILPFIALGFVGAVAALPRPFSWRVGVRRFWEQTRLLAALGAAAILFGAALLGFNFASDYAAFRGELSLAELPMTRAMLRRAGADAAENAEFAELRALPHFLSRQFYRVGAQTTPFALSRLWEGGFELPEPGGLSLPPAPIAVGVLAMAAALGGLALARIRGAPASPLRRYWIPLAALALFGLCWSVAWRGNTLFPAHDHEAVFYVGVPLALAAIALIWAKSALGERLGGRLAIASGLSAAALFALSAFHMSQVGRDDVAAEFEYALMAELGAMRETARGKAVMVAEDVNSSTHGSHYLATEYYFAGSYLARPKDGAREPDFVVSRYRDDAFAPLTPDNALAFLYEGADVMELYRAERRDLLSSAPDAEGGGWKVYADGATLRYLKAPCAESDAEPRFFAHAYPADPNDLPQDRRRDGFYGTNPRFYFTGKTFDGACVMLIDIPRYPIVRIETGQYVSGEGEIWRASIKPTPNAETLAFDYQAIAATLPAARSEWDVYTDGETIAYLKEPCSEDDARGRFLLSVYPADLRDIPEERRALGHESLNFDFERWGVMVGGKCMVRRALPDYNVARVETGQWIPGGERLWTAEIAVGD